MSLIEELGRDALLIALTRPQIHTEVTSRQTADGGYEQIVTPVPVNSIAQNVLAAALKANPDVAEELFDLAVEHLRAHPEIIAERLSKTVIEILSEKFDRYSEPSKGWIEMIRAARESAGTILSDDAAFRARVLDMAGLSDSDRIHVSVELKPAGGNAR